MRFIHTQITLIFLLGTFSGCPGTFPPSDDDLTSTALAIAAASQSNANSDDSGTDNSGSGSAASTCFSGNSFTTSASSSIAWQSNSNDTAYTYSNAVSHCSGLGGRLPTMAEATAAVAAESDCTGYDPVNNKFHKGVTVPVVTWTSDSGGPGVHKELEFGTVAGCTQGSKLDSSSNKVRCVCDL